MAVNVKEVEKDGQTTYVRSKKPANISSDLACGLMGATEEKMLLPAVNMITASPVLYEDRIRAKSPSPNLDTTRILWAERT